MIGKFLRLVGANREPEAFDSQFFEREFQPRIGRRKGTHIVGIMFQEHRNGSCDQFFRCISAKRESCGQPRARAVAGKGPRSEEHTSELQSLMRISYAV